jgi:hypothetical protein
MKHSRELIRRPPGTPVASHRQTKEEHHDKGQGRPHHAGRPFRPDVLRSMLGQCAKSQQPMIVKTAFAVLLMVSLLGIAACGDNDADEGGTTASPSVEATSTTAAESNEPILIKTHLAPPNVQGKPSGEVVSGSAIGDSAFCARGKFIDGPVVIPSRLVLRSFRCPGGTLTITFTSTPPGVKQSSVWKVVNGLGRFKGLSGGAG